MILQQFKIDVIIGIVGSNINHIWTNFTNYKC